MRAKMKKITTEKAPGAIGPYSQAVASGNFVFTSGQIAIDPSTNQMAEDDIEKQTLQVLENLKNILLAAGSSLEKAVKVTVYLADINDFAKMNAIYEKYFTQKPSRSTVQAAKLPKNARIEIDVVAEK